MDQRLIKRAARLAEQLKDNQTAIINRWNASHADKVAAERFMNNDNLPLSELNDLMAQSCQTSADTPHVLMIQDTSFYRFEADLTKDQRSRFSQQDQHIGRHRTQSDHRGIYAHPTIAVDAATGMPLGLPHLHLYHLPLDSPDKHERNYKALGIEEKHSYRWVSSVHRAAAKLPHASRLTVIADREADIYGMLAQPYDERVDLLIRSNYDRLVTTPRGDKKVSQLLAEVPWMGHHTAQVYDKQQQGGRRPITLSVRYRTVSLKRPERARLDATNYPEALELNVVEAKQLNGLGPKGKPVHWIIYTTQPVADLDQAIGVLDRYGQRWWIEDFFRLTKKKGFGLESSRFASGIALKRLMYLVFEQAVKVLALRQGRTNEDLAAASQLSPSEIAVLRVLSGQLSSRPKSQRCPYRSGSLAWAVFLIATLGGWSGRDAAKRPPGVITLLRGYKKLRTMTHAYQLFNADDRGSPAEDV